MAFIEPMHRNKPNITYLLTGNRMMEFLYFFLSHSISFFHMGVICYMYNFGSLQ